MLSETFYMNRVHHFRWFITCYIQTLYMHLMVCCLNVKLPYHGSLLTAKIWTCAAYPYAFRVFSRPETY